MLPQAVPMAPVMKAVMRRIRCARVLSSVAGEARNLLYLGKEKSVRMSEKIFAKAGKAAR